VEPLVSKDVWDAAQRTLERYRVVPSGAVPRTYLLRSVITCGRCDLHYCGVNGRPGVHWFRCNGYLKERGGLAGRCPGKAIRGDQLERIVWDDLERRLREPGDLIQELNIQDEGATQSAVAEAERITLEKAMADAEVARDRAVSLCVRGVISDEDLQQQLGRLDSERAEIRRRLDALRAGEQVAEAPIVPTDLLVELRQRLAAGLDIETKQKLVQLLCRIVVHTEFDAAGKKSARLAISYRFPAPVDDVVVPFSTGTGSYRNYTQLQRVLVV
jgi:site-specific DNA recombinase